MKPDKAETVRAFGWQWLQFRDFHDDPAEYDAQFLDWVYPLAPPFFNEKVVLDAGCGMGRFTAACSHLGAQRVIGVDLSESVEAAREFTRQLPNVSIVEADIYHLPFDQPFDFAFSIGVVHHLPNPEAGLKEIASHVKPDGSVFAWVYGYENNGWIRTWVNPVRERLTSKLPRPVLYLLSLAMTAVAQPILKLLYLREPEDRLARLLPYFPYLHWLAGFGFRHNHHVIFDHLNAPTAFYVRKEEFADWFRHAGLHDVELSWRNQNSWRGHGRRRVVP